MTMKRNSSSDNVSSGEAPVWEMSCQQMTEIIMDDNETSLGWREFQEEIKKSEFVTTQGVKQILAKALQSRVEELDRRARVQEDTWEESDGEVDNEQEEWDEEEPELDINTLFSSPDSTLRGPASWSDSFRSLSLAGADTKVNKRGTMNMLMSGLVGEEVQESSPPQSSPSISPKRSGMNRRGSVVATNLNRRGSIAVGQRSSPATSSRRLTGAHNHHSPPPSARRMTGAHIPSPASSSRRMSVNPTSSRRLSVALSPKTSRKMSMVTSSTRTQTGGGATSTKETARRGSMFADMMRLEDEQKFSMSQAINNGTFINRRGSNGVDFMSTTDYSDVIHRKDDDDDCSKIRSFKRLESGKYATAKNSQGYFVTAMDSAFDTAKAMIEVAKSA